MALLAVERIKLLSTRSPWWCMALAFGLTAGLTTLVVGTSEPQDLRFASTQYFYSFGMVVIMVMAAVAVTTEYRFSTIRATFTAVPNRSLALLAKAAVVGLLAGAVGEVTAFASWGLARLVKPQAELAITDSADWRNVAGVGLVYLVAAVLAVAVGILVRQTAAAVAILLVYTLLVENLVVLIPRIGQDIQDWLPFTAARHFLTGGQAPPVNGQGPPLLSGLPYGPWAALAYFAGIAALLLVAALVTAERRDA